MVIIEAQRYDDGKNWDMIVLKDARGVVHALVHLDMFHGGAAHGELYSRLNNGDLVRLQLEIVEED